MILNQTRKKVLTNKIKMCNTVLLRATGLIFRKKLDDKGYIFRFNKIRRINLHMLFVFQTIDVLLLDSDNIVIEMKKSFRPFTFFNSRKKSSVVIELPQGTINKTRTRVGDKIKIR